MFLLLKASYLKEYKFTPSGIGPMLVKVSEKNQPILTHLVTTACSLLSQTPSKVDFSIVHYMELKPNIWNFTYLAAYLHDHIFT